MENLHDKINSSALFHTVDGALFHTVRNAMERLTVRFSTPSRAFFPFPTVRFSTPYIEYAIHSVSFSVPLVSVFNLLRRLFVVRRLRVDDLRGYDHA